MTSTTYRRAGSVEEALAILAGVADDAKVLAGGQSLIPIISLGLARPGVLVDIGRIAGFEEVGVDGDSVAIRPMVRHRQLATAGPGVDRAAPLLRVAVPWIGHDAIRNRGTFVGSLAHADPAAEWQAVALALDVRIAVRSAGRGTREVAAADFFLGPLTTVLEPDELITEVRLPAAPAGSGAAVVELAYRHGDYAVVGVAAQVTPGPDGSLAEARIGLFGVGATPIRARAAEAVALAGPAAFAEAGRAAMAEAEPFSDATASAEYRRDMVAVYVRRALESALDAVPARTALPGSASFHP